MTRATPATPRTAAGRALLRICQREFDAANAASAESYILAIEQEAASPAADGLDVERLGQALDNTFSTQVGGTAPSAYRQIVAAEYARLAAPPRPHDERGTE